MWHASAYSGSAAEPTAFASVAWSFPSRSGGRIMRSLAIAVLSGILTLTAIPTAAQGQSSAVQGRVVDESGAALRGVVVLVTHQGSGMFRQVVSNADGSYFVTGILPGPYRITAEVPGFKKYDRSDVLLQIGNTTTLDIRLALGGV